MDKQETPRQKKINKVLQDIFSQDYKKFKLIISDNASKDKNYEICKKWLKKKKNIKTNISPKPE